MATKRSVRKRVAKALKKFVRGNPAKKYELTFWGAAGRKLPRYKRWHTSKASIEKTVGAVNYALSLKGQDNVQPIVYDSRGNQVSLGQINPASKSRTVRLKNFTGTITRLKGGKVKITGKGRR